MTGEDDYELVLTAPARRALAERLPESVAAAVIDFMTSALVREPRRVGKPLRRELAGLWSARRGTYRILHRVNEEAVRSSLCTLNTDATPTGTEARFV